MISVRGAGAPRGADNDSVLTIAAKFGAQVEALFAVRAKTVALVAIVVNQRFNASGGQGGPAVVEVTVDLFSS